MNASVPLPIGPGFVRATGPTASYSIGGLASMAGGVTAFFCNATPHQMTVLHEYSGATAGDRITTPSGGSVIVQPGATVAFTRDAVSGRWRMWWDSVEWNSVTGKPSAVTRIQDMTGTYGSIDVAGSLNGWAGIRFPDSYQDSTLMLHSPGDIQGIFRQESNTWSWYWHNGTLVVGWVPWANIINKPTTLAGYGITDAAPINSPAFTGTPTAPTPAGSDNSTKLATTAFVQSALASGGSLLATSTMSPTTKTGSVVFSSTSKPGQMPLTETTTTSLTPVNVLSITGKGRLRFLGVGHSGAGGTVRLNIIVNGVTIASDAQFSGPLGGLFNTSLVVPVVGATTTSGGPDAGTYLISPVPEEGFEFTTSLTIQAYVFNGIGFVGWSYRLYT